MVVGAYSTAGTTVGTITHRVDLTAVCISRITVRIARITARKGTRTGCTTLRTIGQITHLTAATAVGHCIDIGLAAVGRIAVAI